MILSRQARDKHNGNHSLTDENGRRCFVLYHFLLQNSALTDVGVNVFGRPSKRASLLIELGTEPLGEIPDGANSFHSVRLYRFNGRSAIFWVVHVALASHAIVGPNRTEPN